jgi:hypothetical protein
MARTAKQVGDAWGRLAGLAVDACQSHHEAHGTGAVHVEAQVGRTERRVPGGEIDGVTVSANQRCPDSWTGTKGEVRVNYEVPVATYLAAPAMRRVPADGPMAALSYNAAAPVDVPKGCNDVVVSLAALVSTLPRGLYVGRLCPVNGGQPNNPVLIFLDDVI